MEDSEKKYYKEMLERTNKIYEQVNSQKESKNIQEENIPLKVDENKWYFVNYVSLNILFYNFIIIII